SALRGAVLIFAGEPGADPKLRPMLEALRARFGDTDERRRQALERLRAALERVDEAAVFTIHSFCRRVLEQAAFESGTPFAMSFLENPKELFLRASTDFWHRRCHGNAVLAALAVERGWDAGAFVADYDMALRYPETRVLPTTPPLDEVLEAFEAACERLRAAWDIAELDALLAALRWNKDAPLDGGSRRDVLARVVSCLEGTFAGNIDALRTCSPDGIEAKAYKRGNAAKAQIAEVQQHAAIQACGEVVEVLGELEYSLVHTFIREAHETFSTLKEERQVLTFDDLLRRLYGALREPERGAALAASIRTQYEVALIDEFQDIDPFQYEIFFRAFENCLVFWIGDPKQAIYSFRGADIFAYLQAHGDADRRFSLGQNWRSAKELVGAVNALFEGARRPFLYEQIGFDPVEAAGRADEAPLRGDGLPPLVWWYVEPVDGADVVNKGDARPLILQALVAEIRRLLSGRVQLGGAPLQPGSIAVLVRTNDQAEEVQRALQEVGIVSVLSKSGDIMASREVQGLEYLLQAVAQPRNAALVRAALATELWGATAAEIDALSRDNRRWTVLLDAFRRWE
ncbi:MAG TPA: UvrD-helicase domain-containing protein, partial [Longimicrobiaceae bacterium]|nr:UvrD-helicase domain-containing protein [Longimicrobiaceae bacterium]